MTEVASSPKALRSPLWVKSVKQPSLLWVAVLVFYLALYLSSRQAAGALLFGIASGALVSAIALGVVLTYKGSGVVNFASGALAMYVAYVYGDLRSKGQVFVPPLPNPLALVEGIAHKAGDKGLKLPHWPTEISFGGGHWGFFPALLVALVFAVVIGLLLHLLVFRPLRGAPPLAKVVASVGLLVLLQAIVVDRFGTSAIALRAELSKKGVTLPRGIIVPRDQLISVGIVLALTAVLWAVYRYTQFGIASRANADNEKSLVLLGHAPNRLAAASWVLSVLLVGLMGILVSTVNTSVDPNTVVLLIVPALAAALIGGFTSFGIAVAAGIAISMGQGLVQQWSLDSWFPHLNGTPLPGIQQIVPLIVIVAVLFARGSALPTRATASALRMPFAPKPGSAKAIGVKMTLVVAVGVVLMLTLHPDWRLGIAASAVWTILALSLVVLTGFVGQVSLAQMALAGAAGFALSKGTVGLGLPFPLGPVMAIAIATAFGIVISLVALRVRGVDLAIVTFALAVAAENIVFNNPKLAGNNFGAEVPPPRLGPAHFGPNDPTAWSLVGFHGDGKIPNPWFGAFCLVVAALAAALVLNFRRSQSGRLSLAVRSNERATASVGVSVTSVKMVAFSLGAFLAGTGGVMYGYLNSSVTSASFGSMASLTLLVYAYLGGIVSVGGALATGTAAAGGIAAVATTSWFHLNNSYLILLGGLGVVVTVVLNPEGIAGETRKNVERLMARVLPGQAASIRTSTPTDALERGVASETPAGDEVEARSEEAQTSGTTA